jgi:hypothetical protein
VEVEVTVNVDPGVTASLDSDELPAGRSVHSFGFSQGSLGELAIDVRASNGDASIEFTLRSHCIYGHDGDVDVERVQISIPMDLGFIDMSGSCHFSDGTTAAWIND